MSNPTPATPTANPLRAADALDIPGTTSRERALLLLALNAFKNDAAGVDEAIRNARSEGISDETVSGLKDAALRLRNVGKSGTSLSDLLKKATGSGGCCS